MYSLTVLLCVDLQGLLFSEVPVVYLEVELYCEITGLRSTLHYFSWFYVLSMVM